MYSPLYIAVTFKPVMHCYNCFNFELSNSLELLSHFRVNLALSVSGVLIIMLFCMTLEATLGQSKNIMDEKLLLLSPFSFFLLLLFKRCCDINKRIDVLEILMFATSMIIKVEIIDQSVVSRVEISKNQTKQKTQK